MFECDTEGRFYDYRAQDATQLYVPPEIFMGKKIDEVMPAEASAVIYEAMAEGVRSGQSRGAIYSLPMADGIRWYELSIASKGERGSSDFRLIILAPRYHNPETCGGGHSRERTPLPDTVRRSADRDFHLTFRRPVPCRQYGACADSRFQHPGRGRFNLYRSRDPALCRPRGGGKTSSGSCASRGGWRDSNSKARRMDGKDVWLNINARVAGQDDAGGIVIEGFIVDITDRKSAETALLESERRYRELVENANSIILRMDKNGVLTFFNEYAETFFGFGRKEIIGKSVIGTIVPELDSSGKNLAMMITNITSDPDRYLYNENENMKKSGERVWISWTNKVIRESDDRDGEVLCIGTDITEQRRAEKALRQTNHVVENSPVVLFRWKAAEGWPVEFVTNNVSQFGYAPEELMTGEIPFMDLIHPGDRQRVSAEVVSYTESGAGSFTQEYRLLTRDGRIVWVDDRTVIERNTAGGVTGYQGILIDISKRRMAEQAVVLSEKKYRELADFMPEIIFEVDRQGVLTYVNMAVVPLLGYTKEEIGSINVLDFFVPEDRDRCRENFIAVSKGEKGSAGEYTLIRKDGTSLPVILYNQVKVTDGKRNGVRGIIVDITELRRMETALRESEAKFHSLFADSGDAQILMDNDMVVDCNEAAARLLGCDDRSRVIGRMLQDFCPDVQPDGMLSKDKGMLYTRRALEERSVRFEWQHRRADGELFYAEAVLTAITVGGEGPHARDAAGRHGPQAARGADHQHRRRGAATPRAEPARRAGAGPHGRLVPVQLPYPQAQGARLRRGRAVRRDNAPGVSGDNHSPHALAGALPAEPRGERDHLHARRLCRQHRENVRHHLHFRTGRGPHGFKPERLDPDLLCHPRGGE